VVVVVVRRKGRGREGKGRWGRGRGGKGRGGEGRKRLAKEWEKNGKTRT
jgi:hypothetical protein